MKQKAAYSQVDELATWSRWVPFADAIKDAPLLPGVYLFRTPDSHQIVYVGHAGERAGGRKPEGIRGRLNIYRSGKGATSGFGEAVLDRALTDETFVSQQLADLRHGNAKRTKEWARDSLAWLAAEICWTISPDKSSAAALEKRIELILRAHVLWNR